MSGQPTRPSPIVAERGATWASWLISGVGLGVCVVLVGLIAGCSIESHDSRLDHCLTAHDVLTKDGSVQTVCDEYDLPWSKK